MLLDLQHVHHVITLVKEKYELFSPSFVLNRYVENESPVPVDFPEDQSLVFDMECCMAEGNFPTLAVAVSTNAW